MDFRSQSQAQPASADASIAVTPGASPYAYKNATNRTQAVFVTGGTVSAITLTRAGSAAIATGATSGWWLVFPGDTLTVTYSVAPTMTAVPM